jgi:hypothetical protein
VTITRAVRPGFAVLAAVVLGAASLAAQDKVRIVQTKPPATTSISSIRRRTRSSA